MNNSNLDELKEHLLEFVAENTSKSKNNFYVCPFCGSGEGQHGTGALWIYEDENRFFCHKCRTGGSIIDFYLNLHNLSNTRENISQAIKELSEKYNIQQSAPYQANQPKRKPKEIERREHIYHNADGSIFGKKTIIKYDDGTKRPFWHRYDKQTKRYISKLTEKAPLYHADKVHNTFDGVIYFVEGEKDVETLESVCRVTATSTPNGGGSKKWIALYNDGLQDKDIIVITDNDETGNAYGKMIARNAIKLAKSVKIIPAATIWNECPPKGDISDIVASIGAEKTQHLLYAAIEKADFYSPESDTDHNQSDSLSREDLPEWILETKYGFKANAELLAEYIQNTENYFLVQQPGQETQRFFWYQNGVYLRVSAKQVQARIKETIRPYGIRLATTYVVENTYKHLTYPDARHYISSESQLDANENIINFQNGILHLDTLELEPHNPKYICTTQIPVNWNPKTTAKIDEFEKFIEHLANNDADNKKTLLEMIGFVLSSISVKKFKQALFLIGNGNAGKSAFLEFMQKLIGENNYCAMPFSELDKRFNSSTLYRKRLAADDDCNYCSFSNISVFKSITGGGVLQCEEKGKQAFPFQYNGLYVVCANNLPLFGGDKGEHVYERILPIQCGGTIPANQRDKNLIEHLYEEREAIVLSAVMALKDAIKRNYTFTMSADSKGFLSRYQSENDIVYQFIEECCTNRTKPDNVTAKVLYDAFRFWCISSGEKYIPKKSEFTESICRYYGIEPKNKEKIYVRVKNDGRGYQLTLTSNAKKELHVYDY